MDTENVAWTRDRSHSRVFLWKHEGDRCTAMLTDGVLMPQNCLTSYCCDVTACLIQNQSDVSRHRVFSYYLNSMGLIEN